MSRTRRFVGGVGGQYAYQLLVTLAGFWLTPFLLGRLGEEQYALWLVATQILFYLAVLDFGVVALLPRQTAYATGRAGDAGVGDDLSSVVGKTLRIVWLQMPFVVAASVLLWMFIPAQWEDLRGPLSVILVLFVALFPFRVYLAVLQGLQELTYLSIVASVGWLVGTVVTVGLILRGAGLYALVLGWGVGQVISAAASRVRLARRFPTVIPRRLPRLSWAEIHPQVSKGGWFSLGLLANVFVTGSDILILARLLPAAEVVAYSMTQKLIATLGNQPIVFVHSAVPALSELRAAGRMAELARVIVALAQGMLLLGGGVAAVVVAVNRGFVTWWVGGSFYLGDGMTAALAASMIIRHWNLSLAIPIFTFGYERRWAWVWMLDGTLNIAGAIILVKSIGPIGVPLASIAAVLVSSIPLNLSLLARETRATIPDLLRPLLPWAVRFVALFGTVVLVSRVWRPSNPLEIGLGGMLAGAVYLWVMLPVARRSALGPYLERMFGALRRLVAGRTRGSST